jgi:biofilm PGA synthesis N-glycosyltransferase PgaC
MQWLTIILVAPYLILLLQIYRSLKKIRPFTAPEKVQIYVSVIIACRNEERRLTGLLCDIANQIYPDDHFEVIVVDDNSTDNTLNIALKFKQIRNIKVISNKGTGKKDALNNGIRASSGSLIITTDADCHVKKEWIGSIVSFYSSYMPDMIICPVRLKSGPGLFRKFQELEFLGLQGITAGTASDNDGTMCNGANLAFTKGTYIKNSGNLHRELISGDDVFLLHSLKRQPGSKIMWLESTDALVTTEASLSPAAFIRQRRRWISKAGSYSDKRTIMLGIVTFSTSFFILSVMAASFINPAFAYVFLTLIIIKSIPDFLILKNTARRYGIISLMNWFIPVQIIYPFYVIGVTASLLFPDRQRNLSSPSQRGT